MTIRRIQSTGTAQSTAKTRRTERGGENFSSYLDALGGTQETGSIGSVDGVRDEGGGSKKREAQRQAGDLLDSLETLGQELGKGHVSESQELLREKRDDVLRTLSQTPKGDPDRELLHRTAVLATVELVKNDRGDYQ